MTDHDDAAGRDWGVEARFDDLDRRQEKTALAIKMLVDKVEALNGFLTRLSEGVDARPAGRVPGGLASLSGGAELAEWVSWLIGFYELTDIPACWPRHGGVVAELEALRGAWVESIGEGPGGMAAVQWHDALGRFVARVHDPRMLGQLRHCLDFGHKDPSPPPKPDGDPADRMVASYKRPHPDNTGSPPG